MLENRRKTQFEFAPDQPKNNSTCTLRIFREAKFPRHRVNNIEPKYFRIRLDQIILDPKLTNTVPRNQYFYTGMDAYIHCIEALAGSYRNSIGDAFARETINLCRKVFKSEALPHFHFQFQ